jgi:hypothetical protein
MFEVKDGCQIPVPYQDKCGHGYSTCRGKTCSNYVLPAYLIDRERKLNELKEWDRPYCSDRKNSQAER